jgi:tetratricopeptide (TPR) repeat protein
MLPPFIEVLRHADTGSGQLASARHRPFEEALNRARLHSLNWFHTRGGLAVLDFIDHWWLDEERAPIDVQRLSEVRSIVAEVRPKSIRVLLERVLDRIFDEDNAKGKLVTALEAYAARLAHDAEYALGAHVYRVTIEAAHRANLVAKMASSCQHRGWCLRELGNEPSAMASFRAGYVLARKSGDSRIPLLIAIDEANLHRTKGRLAKARRMLHAALQGARRLDRAELIGRAAHELGLVLFKLGRQIDALVSYSEAFRTLTNVHHRHRLLNDIGRSFQLLGFIASAKDAWLVVHAAVRGEPAAQGAARVNLMVVAYSVGDHARFDEFRSAVKVTRIPPRLRVGYYFEMGEGLARFGRFDEARVAYARSAKLAERSDYVAELQKAREALNGRRRWEEPDAEIPPTDFPAVVTELVDAITTLRSTLAR